MAYAVFTREDIAAYAAAIGSIESIGLAAIAMPVTRTEATDRAELRAAIARDYDIVMVASARAASAVIELDREVGAEARPTGIPAGLRELWAVGPATARVLTAAGLAARVPDLDGADAVGLARAILDRLAGTAARPTNQPVRVLAPRAEDGRTDGIALLRAGGVVVDEIVAYRTLARAPHDPAIADGLARLRAGEAAVTAVFAPSQVGALVSILGDLASIRTRFVAIGDTTAEALARAGVPCEIARAPTPAGMAEAIAAVYPPTR